MDPQTPSKTPLEPDGNDPKSSSNPPKQGWIDDLARRSTGLPQDHPAPNPSFQPKSETPFFHLAGLGIQFAGTVAIFAFMGYALDKRLGWAPWGLICGTLIAVIGNLYLLIKESLKEDQKSGNAGPKSPKPPAK